MKQREIEWEELDEQRHRQAHKELEQQEKDLLLLKQVGDMYIFVVLLLTFVIQFLKYFL